MLINVYVTSPDPDPNPGGGGQLPNPNESNSTLTSGTNNIYPYPYIDVNDRGHRLPITHTSRRSLFSHLTFITFTGETRGGGAPNEGQVYMCASRL